MRRISMAVFWVWLAAAWAAAAPAADSRLPSEVIRHPGGAEGLSARLAWALRGQEKVEPGRRFWVGYSIQRLMGENEMIGSFTNGMGKRQITIEEILAGKTMLDSMSAGGDDVRRTTRDVLDSLENRKKPENKVPKSIAILLSYEAGKTVRLDDVDLSNLDLSFDFQGRALYWLGEAREEDSLELIKGFFARAESGKAKKGLISAAGLHGNARLVVPFLETILRGGDSDDLRKDAAFWIGQQNDAAGLRVLIRAAESDLSKEVREGAVFAISQVELPEAVDELIALARKARLADVRKQAVFWLGQVASEKASPTLEEFARKDGDLDVQEQAVFALSQLPANEGVEPLIKLAKTHPDPRIRKKAIFWLGECHDPRALEALIAIIKGK
jgi:hypothetical protein